MATVSAAAPASTFAGTATLPGRPALVSPSSVLGLPRLACEGGGTVRCSTQGKPAPRGAAATVAAGAGSAALAMLATAWTTGPALALVDERMSTEGTGLSLGISNNLLAWILLGVFGLVWALYFTYTATLDEDDDSALSL